MYVESQDYKSEVLEYAVNQCIDKLLPSSSEDALSVILYQSNEVVWRVATEIYTKSGHQIDFVFIRDVLNLRIEPLRKKIAEEERIRVEQERIKKEKEAEEEKFRKQREEEEQKRLQEYEEVNQELSTCEIFEKTKSIIVEQLEVEPDRVTPEANVILDLGADDLDAVELIMALEGEFDIEIPDDNLLVKVKWFDSTCSGSSTLKPFSVQDILDLLFQQMQLEY